MWKLNYNGFCEIESVYAFCGTHLKFFVENMIMKSIPE